VREEKLSPAFAEEWNGFDSAEEIVLQETSVILFTVLAFAGQSAGIGVEFAAP